MTPDSAPTTPRREERRDSIIQIARDIFLADGFSATSMATIAARVGGSKGTLYNYFPSKEELFSAVVQDYCDRKGALLSSFEFEDGEFRTALRLFGRRIIRVLLSDEVIAMHRLITAEISRFPEIGATFYAAGMNRSKEKLRDRFAAAMDAGHIRRADPTIAALHFVDLCLSGIHRQRLWAIATPTDQDMDANVEAAVETFLDGYCVK